MKYIFLAGAPGSKWSSVNKNIYYSPDIDHSDYSDSRTYYHDAPGTMQLMHLGAYFDPGMEFGDILEDMHLRSKEELEAEFDRPFTGTGIRIIKSHVFANNIDQLKQLWSDCPIVMCYRNDDECLGWWVKCGHFNITYPLYDKYYRNLRQMGKIITEQNAGIIDAERRYDTRYPINSHELCDIIGIKKPLEEYLQNYKQADVKVMII
jgi:hypothetical protein